MPSAENRNRGSHHCISISTPVLLTSELFKVCASSPWSSCARSLSHLFVVLHYGELLVSHRITVKLQLTGKSRLAYKFYSDSLQGLNEDDDDDDDDDDDEMMMMMMMMMMMTIIVSLRNRTAGRRGRQNACA